MNSTAFSNIPQWKEIFETLPLVRSFFEGDPDSLGLNSLLRNLTVYFDRLLNHMDRRSPFIWYNLGFSSELVYAMGDVCPIPVEMLGTVHSLVGNHRMSLDFIDTAHASGIPTDCCSADKISAGAMHKGCYPAPALAIGINTPCDAQVMNSQVIAELSGAPFFSIDVPYHDDNEAVEHVAAQLKELVEFMEEVLGHSMDIDRLREVCENSNRMTEALWEWLDWRKLVPLTQSSKVVAFTLILQILFTGSAEGVDIAENLLREARERSQRNERFFEERVRAVWYQDAVWTDMQIYDWFERELGLTIPVDVFGYYAQEGLIDTRNETTMLKGLANKLVRCQPMSRQFRGDIDLYIRDFMNMVEGWNADCCIFAGHVTCKHAWGGIGLFKEALRKADIPLLIFEFDMFDPRITSWEDIYFQVERFVDEIVYPRKLRSM